MCKIVKSLGIAVMACGCAFSVPGQAGEANLLKEWNIYGNGNTIIQADGVIACECKGDGSSSGVTQCVGLNQAEAKIIEFSAESKAENVSGELDAQNYSIFIDITHSDGSKTYDVTAAFKTGTHDWEKASLSCTPTKPVKFLQYHLLFRNKTGKVWFKNAVLIQK